jgi:hypothetical protein
MINLKTPDAAPRASEPQAMTFARLARAKRAYTVRHVPVASMHSIGPDAPSGPRAGDLVLARVERIGKHAQLELTDSRRSTLFVGDEVVVAYAARYAPDQFEAVVPDSLGACHLAAAGGVAASVRSRHAAVAAPTELMPLGLLLDRDGQRLNLEAYAIESAAANSPRPLTIASLGTSMNSGKTTTAAHLIRGLVRAGLTVGAAKITGTGSGNDPGLLRDAGAALVLDFTDAGHASTFGIELPPLLRILESVQARMCAHGVDVLVIEVADGLLQRETAMLIESPRFSQRVDAALFSSGEAMGAIAGMRWLADRRLPVLGLAGTLTRSPLARAEAEAATGLASLGLDQLGDAQVARGLFERARRLAHGARAA